MKNYRKAFPWRTVISLIGVLCISMCFMWVQHFDHQNMMNLVYEEMRELRAENMRQRRIFGDENPGIELPKSLATNNPGNVKSTGWKGQIGSDKSGHAIFSHYEYGLRAIAIVLKNYQTKHGLKTLHTMMKRYCEGNQLAYAKFIGKKIGVGIDEEFDVLEHLPEMMKAIVKFETGEQPYPDHAFALAGIYATTD